MKRKLLIYSLLPLLLSGCNAINPGSSKDQPGKDDPITPGGEKEEEITPNFNNSNVDYNDFFNHGNDVEVIVKFTNEVAKKTNDYGKHGSWLKQEMYHPCNVTININGEQRFYAEESGIRLKGNLSKERDPDFVNSNGELQHNSHFKVNFSETFDNEKDNDYYTHTWESSEARSERKDRKFGGMKKLDFKWNRNEDQTFTKEAYAKYCYRDAGVVAQSMNLIKFTVQTDNDSKTYIYQVFETVDKPFLKQYFSKNGGQGNLYKGLYARANLTSSSITGTNLDPESENNTSPTYPLKTNEDAIDHTLMKNVVSLLNKKSTADEFVSAFENLAEVDSILKYLAMSWVIGNPDDMKNNANNTYFYFNSVNDNLYIIPYDDDRCFGIMEGWEIDMSSLPADSTRMQGKTGSGSKVWVDNPLIWRLTITESDSGVSYSDKWPMVQAYHDRYMAYAQEYVNKYLDENKFQEFTNGFINAPSKDISSGGASNQTFAYYATNKKANISK